MRSVRSDAGLPPAAGSVVGPSVDPASAPKDARSGRAATTGATCIRPTDLDLLRLGYVCLANALLQDLPERSLVLSRIHGFFDMAPDPESIERFSLFGRVDRERVRRALLADPGAATRGEI